MQREREPGLRLTGQWNCGINSRMKSILADAAIANLASRVKNQEMSSYRGWRGRGRGEVGTEASRLEKKIVINERDERKTRVLQADVVLDPHIYFALMMPLITIKVRSVTPGELAGPEPKGRLKMKRTNLFKMTQMVLVTVGLVLSTSLSAMGEEVNWDKHLIDGVQLTGNYDTRYLNADPSVKITVEGRSQKEADNLVSGSDPGGKTGIRWAKGQKIAIVIDMKAERLVSGIVISKRGKIASLQLSTSLDGRDWRVIPKERLTDAGGLVAGNLALPARYLRFDGTAAGDKGAYIGNIVAYGQKQVDLPMIGGIYPSWFPPVAGKEIKLRAVIRNMTDKPAKGLVVKFTQTAPEEKVLGEQTIDTLDPYSAKVASIPWKALLTDPYKIEVTVTAQEEEIAAADETIPVVNRRLYFSNFYPFDSERLKYTNMYTTIGGGYETFMANLRGRMGLYVGAASPTGTGASKTKGVSAERLYKHYKGYVMGAYRDGANIDEYASSTITPAVSEAMRKVGQERQGRFIVPWLIGKCDENVAKAFEYTDLVLAETYFNWQHPTVDPWIHHQYRSIIDSKINSARKWGMLNKHIFALGCFIYDGCVATSVADIEREVQYIRLRGAEMPGICYYGGYYRGKKSTFNLGLENLSYKYFIAPVVRFTRPWEIKKEVLYANIWNVGGMTARDIVVSAVDASTGERMGFGRVLMLPPGQKKSIQIKLPTRPAHLAVKIEESSQYTALNYKTLELIPDRQMRGVPVRVSWTPLRKNEKLTSDDSLEVVSRKSGKVVYQAQKISAGLPSLPTGKLPAGEYDVRIVGGPEKLIKVSVPLVITPTNTRFFVSRVNGKPWTGNPQEVTIRGGDTFEVTWDMGDWQLSGNAAIYASAPSDDPTKKPDKDSPRVKAALASFASRVKNREMSPYRGGRWTWNSSFKVDKGVPVSDSDSGGASKPGIWKLWFNEKAVSAKPLPWVPMITVIVKH